MNSLMHKLQNRLSRFLNENDSVLPLRKPKCVETIRLDVPIFAQIQECTTLCGHQNYLVELFDGGYYDTSIGLIHWSDIESAIRILKESAHAIDALETEKMLKA